MENRLKLSNFKLGRNIFNFVFAYKINILMVNSTHRIHLNS